MTASAYYTVSSYRQRTKTVRTLLHRHDWTNLADAEADIARLEAINAEYPEARAFVKLSRRPRPYWTSTHEIALALRAEKD